MAGTATENVRLAELAASLSLATDIGLGVSPEHGARSALLAVALAEAAGCDEAEARDAFYVALLKTVGCTGDDDFGVRVLGETSGNWIAHMAGASPAEFLGTLVRNVGRADGFPRRIGKVLRALGKGPGAPTRAHCEVGRLLAERLGLSARVARAMTQVFERWDGRGRPDRLKGEAIDRVVRLVQLASDAQAARRLFGTDETVALVRRRAGGGYDPKLVEIFCRRAPALFAALEVPSVHDALVEAEPGEPVRVAGDALDAAVETVGQYGDMKSRFTRGHSAGVAALAGRAAARQGLGAAEAIAVRRAGHLHDVGRAGVVLDIWDKPGPLTAAEWERARMHSYFTERVLARLDSLAPVPELAALAHERLDGGGYHRRLSASGVPAAARILAAADAYHAMTEPRPHRPALTPERAAATLRADAAAGRLDRDAVEAVIGAAGQPAAPARRTHAAGLTDREVEVVRLVARGLTNKEIASALDISVKTAGHHVQHIFEKAGVTTRAAAALFAMQNDLVDLGAGR
ncbi:MAG TPA: HD domain-containing phosphohydrolase [Polyangia bacterium]